MTTTLDTRYATRDDVLATRTAGLSGYYATTDTNVSFRVLGPVPGDFRSLYATSDRTNQLVMVTRTGTRNVPGKGEQVRVRFAFAADTGDAAGTLRFDFREARTGGVAPRVLFGWVAV